MASERERTICGPIKERFYFWMWSRAAPRPNSSRVANFPLIEPVAFETSDGRTLAGYRYVSHDKSGQKVPARGYILMAMGNAMVSDQIVPELREFAQGHYDVYVYDYRGYGNSEGKRRINAIIADYKEIVATLNDEYERGFLYGVSLGGAVMMNVLGSGMEFDRAVVDSSPSRFSPFGCPATIDPMNNIPDEVGNLMVITGQKDGVLGDGMTAELREEVERRGGTTVDGEAFDHPFMDSPRVHDERMNMVREFLMAGSG